MKLDDNPYLPRVDLTRLRKIVDVGHSQPAPPIVTHSNFGAGFPDADRDGVPDMFDCAPLDPAADGWLGDAYKRAKTFFTPNYAVAASRRASVSRAVSGAAGRAASAVRRAPPSPSRYVARRVSAAVSRRAAPAISRVVRRPSPADLKRVTAAAFPKTAATIRAAAELKKAVGAVRPPSRAELVQAGVAAVPGGIAAVAAVRGVVAAKPTFEAVVARTREMIREPPYKVEVQARTERQKYERMVGTYQAKYPDPSKPLPEQQKYSEMSEAYQARYPDPSKPLSDADYKQARADHQRLVKQQMRMESEYARVAGDYQAIQEQQERMDSAYKKTVSAGAERYLKEQQAKAPQMSPESRWIAEQTGRVAEVARGFEEPVEEKMQSIEERLGLHSKWIPEPVKTIGWGVKELGYGIAFTGTSAAVEMAGMVPGGVEVMAKKPSIIAPAAIYGTYLMGKGALESATKSPTRFAGELVTFGALMKGGEIALKPVTPTIIHAEGYTGVGIKGFKKPIRTTVEAPAIRRGGVYEAELLKKPPTAPKDIITGYSREPVPLIGVRTKSGIPPVEGVTATYRGLQVGKQWTPAEYYKAAKIDTITTPEGTLFEARHGTQVRVGKLRYEKEAVARGAMEGGYFLPKARAPAKPTFPEITTAEKGIIPLEPAKFPLSLDVVTPKTLKPTRFYGEVRRPYAKVGEARLFGSEARMRWTELGERRLIYGVEGAAKQPKIIIEAERWGYHPTYPPGIAAGKAVSPAYFRGYTPPKQIPRDIYSITKGVPASSKFFDMGHLTRPTKPKPIETAPTIPADRSIGVITPRIRSEGIAPIPELVPEVVRVPEAAKVLYAEPTVCIGGVCYRDVGIPMLQRVPPAKLPAKPKVAYAEPFKPDPAFQRLWDEVGKADSRALTVEGAKPRQRPRPGERGKTAWDPFTPTSPATRDVTAPHPTTFATILPIPAEAEEAWRKTMPLHLTDVKITTETVTEPAPLPEMQPYPTPIPYPEPPPGDMPPPSPDPWGGGYIPPSTPTPFPEPPLPKLKKPIVEDEIRRRKSRGERDPFAWHIENPLITLEEFFANPPQPKKPVKPVGMIPMIPAGVV